LTTVTIRKVHVKENKVRPETSRSQQACIRINGKLDLMAQPAQEGRH
jgi:hypothetical protein